jgi:hypothetical protein
MDDVETVVVEGVDRRADGILERVEARTRSEREEIQIALEFRRAGLQFGNILYYPRNPRSPASMRRAVNRQSKFISLFLHRGLFVGARRPVDAMMNNGILLPSAVFDEPLSWAPLHVRFRFVVIKGSGGCHLIDALARC